MINRLTFFPADPGQRLDGPLRGEDAHEIIVEAQKELAGAVVTLSSGPAPKLIVDSPGLVPLGAEDMQSADLGDAGPELDICSPAGHIRRDGDITPHRAVPSFMLLAGLDDNDGLSCMLFGVEHLVFETVLSLKSLREHFAFFNTDRSDEQWPAGRADLVDLFHDGIELLFHRLVNDILAVIPDARLIRRNDDDFELVDIHEFVGFGGRGARHSRDLIVELEKILQGNRGERLAFFFDRDGLLGLDGLMEPVGPLPAVHEPAGKFVDDNDFAVHDDIVFLSLERDVSPQTLL